MLYFCCITDVFFFITDYQSPSVEPWKSSLSSKFPYGPFFRDHNSINITLHSYVIVLFSFLRTTRKSLWAAWYCSLLNKCFILIAIFVPRTVATGSAWYSSEERLSARSPPGKQSFCSFLRFRLLVYSFLQRLWSRKVQYCVQECSFPSCYLKSVCKRCLHWLLRHFRFRRLLWFSYIIFKLWYWYYCIQKPLTKSNNMKTCTSRRWQMLYMW